ncbi:MAG: hypothetical protein JRJ70_12615 [Deltaproteobacteria bacterium]|nr:hypothetical protein [Deltaproteobacteria bacterium]
MEKEGTGEIAADSRQGPGLRIRFISKIVVLSTIIIVFALQNAHSWECEVTLDGPNVVKVGQTITLSASGTPDGGSYSWSATPNLIPSGATAQLTGYKPESSEYIWVTVKYTSPSGRKCSAVKGIWVCICYVKITGPTEVKVGDPPITLTAEGDPSGGSYEWSDTPGLVPNGSEAQFTGQSPGDFTIEVTYKTPEGETCYDTHAIIVLGECSVSISGPSVVGVGNSIELSASGSPTGGTFIWTPESGLVPGTSFATFFGEDPGAVIIEVAYTPPDSEKPCYDTHNVTVFGVESITGPSCVNSGTILTREDFTIVTDPTGFDDQVIVSPLSFSTLSQSEGVTVTAYSGTGAASDEATTTIIVVNSNVKNEKAISFEIPNYVNDVLKKIALGDKTDLSVKCNFKDFKECCDFGIATSVGGSLNANLSVEAGPFTIIGIPMPPKAKKWVAADLLNVALSGGGNVGIDGSYESCGDRTGWAGGGDLTAEVELGGEVTAQVPQAIILNGEIKGSTSITEKLSTDLTDLKITTNWGGLTGLVRGKIKIFRKEITFEVKKTYFEQDNLLPIMLPLPNLD